MEDETDVTIAASELSPLLGHAGDRSQVNFLQRLWQQSARLKDTAPEWKHSNGECREEEQAHQQKLQVSEAFRDLQAQARACDHQQHMSDLLRKGFLLLFRHPLVVEPDQYARYFDDFDDKLPRKITRPPEQLWEAIKTCVEQMPNNSNAKVSFRLLKQLHSTASRNYGIRGEQAYRELHNRVSTVPITQGNRNLRRVVSEPLHLSSLTSSTSSPSFSSVPSSTSSLTSPHTLHTLHTSPNTLLAPPAYTSLPASSNPSPSQFTHLSHLTHLPLRWSIVGRIDGMRGNQIVEIKHRTGLLPENPPLRDLIQMHAYMYMMDQTSAVLIQCVRLAEGFFTKECLVTFDRALWQDVVSGVSRALMLLHSLHTQPLARDCFWLLDDGARAALIHRHIDPSLAKEKDDKLKVAVEDAHDSE